jgi:DNA uptake protein ComE-like DNA-binding protein
MPDLSGVRGGVRAAAVWVALVAVGWGGGRAEAQTASKTSAPKSSTQASTPDAQTPPAKPPTIAEKIAASKGLLDINTATAAQLKALPGMGDEYVRRVIAGRPYTAKNQLATRGVIPQAEYEQIRELIVAHRVKP